MPKGCMVLQREEKPLAMLNLIVPSCICSAMHLQAI